MTARRLASSARLSALLLGAVLAGCGGGGMQQGPSDALRAYAAALEEGRADDAYRLLAEEARRTTSLEAFRRMVKENREDMLEIARALARPASDPLVTATVTAPGGESLTLLYEDGRWRIDAAAVDLYSQATPRKTLLTFLRAFERRRYDVILRLVPDAEKERFSAAGDGRPPPAEGAPPAGGEGATGGARGPQDLGEPLTAEKLRTAWEGPDKERVQRTVQALRAALPTSVIEETGDRAAMAYGAGGTLSFVREHGVWKIEDFD